MQAVKAVVRARCAAHLVGWAVLAWMSTGPLVAQGGEEATAGTNRGLSPTAVADASLSPPACGECGSATCPHATDQCSYFDGVCCECGVDTRMYRSLILARLWVEAEYLAWSSAKTHLPPLLSTGTLSPPSPAVLLFGDDDVHGDLRSGGRLTGGYWFTPEHRFGLEGSFFDIDVGDTKFLASGADYPGLARPILNFATQEPDSIPVSYPGQPAGTSLVRSDVELLGAEALLRHVAWSQHNYRVDGVAGYRYLRLHDGLQVNDVYGSTVSDQDKVTVKEAECWDGFGSENEFHGGEVGLIGRWWGRRWALQLLGKAALGGTRTVTKIDGSTVTTTSTTEGSTTTTETDVQPGGVLALPSNIGGYAQSRFAAAGELGIRVEYALTHQLYATFGYTFIYWSSVARVTEGIDLVVDRSQIPQDVNSAATRPGFAFHNSDFWTQGLNLGLHYEF